MGPVLVGGVVHRTLQLALGGACVALLQQEAAPAFAHDDARLLGGWRMSLVVIQRQLQHAARLVGAADLVQRVAQVPSHTAQCEFVVGGVLKALLGLLQQRQAFGGAALGAQALAHVFARGVGVGVGLSGGRQDLQQGLKQRPGRGAVAAEVQRARLFAARAPGRARGGAGGALGDVGGFAKRRAGRSQLTRLHQSHAEVAIQGLQLGFIALRQPQRHGDGLLIGGDGLGQPHLADVDRGHLGQGGHMATLTGRCLGKQSHCAVQ